MREFREIDDIEDKLRVSERKRMTPEEASEFVRKFDKSFEESMVEKDQVSSEAEYERTKRAIQEYIEAEEKSEELIDEILYDVSEEPLKTDNLEIDHIEIRGGTSERDFHALHIREKETKECNESLEKSRAEKEKIGDTEIFAPYILESHRIRLKEVENISSNEIVDIIENLPLIHTNFHVIWMELPKISQIHNEQFSEIEELLNFRVSSDFRFRIGAVDDRLYIRRHDTSEYNWFNIYKNEHFHFHSTDQKLQLVDEMKSRLSVSTNTSLGVLIDQLTDRDLAVGNGLSDLRKRNNHLRGETLHLILDTTGQTLHGIQHMIEHIGKKSSGIYHNRGCITNPRFPTNPEVIDMMFAKFFGLGLSDGNLSKGKSEFAYWEKDIERMNIVIQHSKDFGDVYHSEPNIEGGTIRIRFSSVLGRALERRGFPVGDKCVLNIGLPDFIRNGSLRTKCMYFSNLWPEDGNFSIEESANNRGRFRWDCSVVLMDPVKEEEYCHTTEVTAEHVELMQRYGKHREEDVKNGFSARIELTAKVLDELIQYESLDISSLAQSLKDIVYRTSCNRLFDEIDALDSVGVCATPYFMKLSFQKATSRLSAGWIGEIGKKIDVMFTSLFMPPDDIRKRAIVEKWIRMNPEIEEEVRRRLTRNGMKRENSTAT